MGKRSNQKKILLVDRNFQLRYAFAAVVVGISSTFFSIALIIFPLYKFEIIKVTNFLPLPIISIIVVAVLINVALIAVLGVILTHKIAGPIFSLVRSFRQVENSNWNVSLKLREGDELNYAVRNFNGMIEAIKALVITDLAELEAVKQALTDSGESNPDSIAMSREKIEKLIAKLQIRIGSSA